MWAGNEIIPGDPRSQNYNGKLFQDFLERNQNLSVVNSLPICEGLITRVRSKGETTEKSILDFFVVCSRILPYVTKMVVDEDRKFILTNYKVCKNGSRAKDSDHFTEYMDVNLKIKNEKSQRKEIFKFKDESSLKTFTKITSNTNQFSSCFDNDKPLEHQIEDWRKTLKSHCEFAFKKIRINESKRKTFINPHITSLVNKRNELLKKCKFLSKCRGVKKEHKNDYVYRLKLLEETISNLEAEENRKKIMERFKKFSENPEKINLQEMWKILNQIIPKHKTSIPIAKKDHRGKFITDPLAIKALLAKEYKMRLRNRPIRSDLGNIRLRKEKILNMQLKLAKNISSPPWKIEDLEKALKCLKNNKCRDQDGYINEIFKPGVIGSDLKKSLLILFNNIKKKKLIPIFMKHANITTVHKKGSKHELKNERGIFRVSVIRSILMRMIYNDNYPMIDKNMTDNQTGGRRGKGCRNNIFMINGIIHDVLTRKNSKPIMLQLYDYSQMFDSIDLRQAISDIYEAGMKDDSLALLYEANKEIFMAVNTSEGLTDRQKIYNSVLQGDTWSSLLASNQVDAIGQECLESGYGFKYKECLPVGMFGFVDDSVGITEAGYKAQMFNALFNIKTAEKFLQFGVKKCKYMLVGHSIENFHKTPVLVDKWSVEHIEDPTTESTNLVERYEGQVEIEMSPDQKYLGFIISSTGDNLANIKAVRNKSNGIIREIFEKLESLNLRKYYFERGILFLNIMLRSSILYACETYYNLKEKEMRILERIEET